MIANRSIPAAVVIPELVYPDVGEAVAWLCRVFGFREHLRIADHRAQLLIGEGGAIVVKDGPAGASPREREADHSVMVRLEDVRAHHEHAVQQGTKILRPPTDYPFGERQYTAEDLGGHLWTFTESLADVDPSSWGGVLVGGGSGG